jgi:hypothetical protein
LVWFVLINILSKKNSGGWTEGMMLKSPEVGKDSSVVSCGKDFSQWRDLEVKMPSRGSPRNPQKQPTNEN